MAKKRRDRREAGLAASAPEEPSVKLEDVSLTKGTMSLRDAAQRRPDVRLARTGLVVVHRPVKITGPNSDTLWISVSPLRLMSVYRHVTITLRLF